MPGKRWRSTPELRVRRHTAQDFDWGPGFVEDAGLKNVRLSPDLKMLKETFPFEDVPYGAVIEDGKSWSASFSGKNPS